MWDVRSLAAGDGLSARRRHSYARAIAASPSIPNLPRLKRAVDAAVIATRTPPTPDATSWPVTIPQQHLQKDDWRCLWDVVRHVRRHHRDLYNQFLFEATIADIIVEQLAELDKPPAMTVLVTELRARAQDETSWLVDIPIANLRPPAETSPLGPKATLVRVDQARRHGLRFGRYLRDPWAVKRHLGDELTPRSRWLQTSSFREVDTDTRFTASLLLVEEGTEEVALSLAQTRARLAIALWCLLSPPERSATTRSVWPTIGGWAPQPFIEFGTQRKGYEPEFGIGRARRRGNRITEWGEYRLTRSEEFLRAPFDAIDEARKGNQSALSVLSAARSLYLAEQIPNDLDRTERVLEVWRAKEALCDRGRRGQGTTDERWSRLVVNLRLRSMLLQRGYVREEIEEAFALAQSLRDLATHRADDVLVNLSYPKRLRTQLYKKRVLDADSASLAVVAADWPLLRATVRTAARRLAKGAIRNGWDESWFNTRFG